jgi:hypothetical protein
MRLWWVLLPALALSGCAALEEKDAALCRADGFTDGSLGFEACLQNRDEQRRMARALGAAEQAEGGSSVASLMFVHR